MLTRQNCDSRSGKNLSHSNQPLKYIITGIGFYRLPAAKLAQLLHTINSKVSYKRNSLFWYVGIESLEVGYVIDEEPGIEIDPNAHIIGIYVVE